MTRPVRRLEDLVDHADLADRVIAINRQYPTGLDVEQMAADMRRAANLVRRYKGSLERSPQGRQNLERFQVTTATLELDTRLMEAHDRVIRDVPVVEKQTGPRPSGSYSENAGTFVYVAYGPRNEVLYVGITDDLFGRMSSHRRASKWWRAMERLDWEEWPDRHAALTKEAILIRRHRPPFNIVGNPDKRGCK